MQLDDRCGKLKSVEIGESTSRFRQYVRLTGGVSKYLLACTASRS